MNVNAELERLRTLKRFSPGVACFNGMVIHYNDPLALYNEYQDIFLRGIYRFVPKTKNLTILDVGGYLGLSTIFFFRNYPQAQITVFEPNPNIFHLLEINIKKNCKDAESISLVNAAVAGKIGRGILYTDRADGDSLIPNEKRSSVEIDVVRLSDYILGTIDFLKINIEGLEKEVLCEIESKLPFVRELVVEYHAFDNLPQNLGEILNLLDRSKFRYIVVECPSTRVGIPFEKAANYRHFNLIYGRNQIHE